MRVADKLRAVAVLRAAGMLDLRRPVLDRSGPRWRSGGSGRSRAPRTSPTRRNPPIWR